MDGQRFNLPPVSMIMLGVRDLDKSVSFYRDRLGIDVRQRIPGFAFLDSGALTIVLSEPLAKNVSPLAGATEVIFSVNDVRASYEALKNQGVEFSQEPRNVSGPMWAANFRDPDGHLLTLFGPERKPS
ncbi:MAG TPA: VOC family protein [Terriglobales bacterium]|nr:VOC family protein [Terriglobales bacterium]